MPDKLTDKEVVKALECCVSEMDCPNCPKKKDGVECVGNLLRDCFDLINRLQAENERLQSRNNFLEIEYKNQGNLFWARVETAKAEAYKDCIEKVKKKYQIFENQAYAINPYALHGFLNNLLKELVGEDNTTPDNKN